MIHLLMDLLPTEMAPGVDVRAATLRDCAAVASLTRLHLQKHDTTFSSWDALQQSPCSYSMTQCRYKYHAAICRDLVPSDTCPEFAHTKQVPETTCKLYIVPSEL